MSIGIKFIEDCEKTKDTLTVEDLKYMLKEVSISERSKERDRLIGIKKCDFCSKYQMDKNTGLFVCKAFFPEEYCEKAIKTMIEFSKKGE